jgi:hypothetical protein
LSDGCCSLAAAPELVVGFTMIEGAGPFWTQRPKARTDWLSK